MIKYMLWKLCYSWQSHTRVKIGGIILMIGLHFFTSGNHVEVVQATNGSTKGWACNSLSLWAATFAPTWREGTCLQSRYNAGLLHSSSENWWEFVNNQMV